MNLKRKKINSKNKKFLNTIHLKSQMDIKEIYKGYQEKTVEKYNTKNDLGKLVYGFSNMWFFETLGNMVKSVYKSLKKI